MGEALSLLVGNISAVGGANINSRPTPPSMTLDNWNGLPSRGLSWFASKWLRGLPSKGLRELSPSKGLKGFSSRGLRGFPSKGLRGSQDSQPMMQSTQLDIPS